jgi:hypothetical protein
MLLAQQSSKLKAPPALQVFATDLDEAAIRSGRDGVYPETIEADVSEERLRWSFSREHGRYAAFNRAVAAANAQAIRKLHGAVAISNPLWILERRWPELYGPPKLRTELPGPSNGTLPVTANPFLVEVMINGALPEHPPIKELPSE